MVDADYDRFTEWFDVLAVTHRLQASDEMRGKMKGEYFDVLKSYPRDAVESAYQTLRRKMKKWPVPADWLEALPPFGSVSRLPLLTTSETAQNDDAERLGYEREDFCSCRVCEAEEATHLKSRYVPLMDANGHVLERRHPSRMGRPILLGHWLHGYALKRWYVSRAKFYELKEQVGLDLAAEADERQTRRISTQDRAFGLTRLAQWKIINNQAPKHPDEIA